MKTTLAPAKQASMPKRIRCTFLRMQMEKHHQATFFTATETIMHDLPFSCMSMIRHESFNTRVNEDSRFILITLQAFETVYKDHEHLMMTAKPPTNPILKPKRLSPHLTHTFMRLRMSIYTPSLWPSLNLLTLSESLSHSNLELTPLYCRIFQQKASKPTFIRSYSWEPSTTKVCPVTCYQ